MVEATTDNAERTFVPIDRLPSAFIALARSGHEEARQRVLMTQSGAGFTTAALFSRPLGASQPAKAVCLASKGVKGVEGACDGCQGVECGMQGCQTCRKSSFRALIPLKNWSEISRSGRSASRNLAF